MEDSTLLSSIFLEKQSKEQLVDQLAGILEVDHSAKDQIKQCLEGGFEDNYLNFDKKIQEQGQFENQIPSVGSKQYEDTIQQYQLIKQCRGNAPEINIDEKLLKKFSKINFKGKIATKEQLKEINPEKGEKLMNQYQEYIETQEKDEHGLPKIKQINNYDLGKYLQTITSLTISGEKFTDSEFPPQKKMLLGDENSQLAKRAALQWLSGPNPIINYIRCSEIFKGKKFQLFEKNIEPQDLIQGSIGNCYFMGAIAALAETPARITKLFVNNDVNPTGCYAINTCQQGLWREIIIDDKIPCHKNGMPAFAKSNGNEIWAMLIEKAWAKMYGGYVNIEGGLGREVFNEMTGAPCQLLYANNPQSFEQIYKGEQLNWPMCCNSNQGSGSHDNKTAGGIANSHLYTLLGGYKVQYQGSTVQLVRLRNPWGKGEWKGSFGDDWPGWNDENLRKQVPFQKKDDGIFYMTFQDFQKEFQLVDICMYFDNYKFTTLQMIADFNQKKFFDIEIKTRGTYFFIAVQESNRNDPKKAQNVYSPIRLTLVQEKNNALYLQKYIRDPSITAFMDQWIQCRKLKPGKYTLGVRCEWMMKKPTKVTLKSYGVDHVTFKSADPKKFENLKF